ncbi:MAG: sigma-70 family RNA polymerase sigma factor [Oscillospiraceae bacterium]|nr:sigma-70 family RNA polymerase sigma factor [Oscillospiraceae bacterium]
MTDLVENKTDYDFNEAVGLAVKGDAEAFALLYAAVYKDLYHVALYSLKNSADAEDVVSETVLDAFSTIRTLRDETAFKAWIMKILSAKIKRKFKEYIKAREQVTYGEEATEPNHDSFDIKFELQNLDNKDKLVLSLSIICGYTSKQISVFTGMNHNTVRTRIARAKEKLKERLQYEQH